MQQQPYMHTVIPHNDRVHVCQVLAQEYLIERDCLSGLYIYIYGCCEKVAHPHNEIHKGSMTQGAIQVLVALSQWWVVENPRGPAVAQLVLLEGHSR